MTPPIDGLLTPPRASSTPAQHTDNLSACTGARSRSAAKDSLAPRFDGLQGRKQASRAHHRARHQAACTQHTALAPRAPFCCAARPRTMRCTPQTRRTPGPAPARLAQPHPAPASGANKTHTQRAYKTRPDQPVRARNVFGSGVRTLAVVRAVLTTIATLTTPLRHVILLGFVV